MHPSIRVSFVVLGLIVSAMAVLLFAMTAMAPRYATICRVYSDSVAVAEEGATCVDPKVMKTSVTDWKVGDPAITELDTDGKHRSARRPE